MHPISIVSTGERRNGGTRPLRLVACVAALLLVACSEQAPPAAEAVVEKTLRPADAALVADGAKVYRQHCASCHGARLEGQPDWRTRGADGLLPAPPHDASGHTWHHADELLFRITKDGVAVIAGGDYKTAMPVYDGVLSDAEIVAVLSWIKAQWPADIQAKHDQINQRYRQSR